MERTNLRIETERLIIRPYSIEDYENWYINYDNRLPSQYKYDDGRPLNMPLSTKEWFNEWINGFYQAAVKDDTYVFGIFRKVDGVNIGKLEISTIPIFIRKLFSYAFKMEAGPFCKCDRRLIIHINMKLNPMIV